MLNKAILMGRLTKDPVMTTSTSGVNITRFTLAIDRKFQKEEKQADFLNIVTFNKTAQFCAKYFVKGQLALVVGSIQTRSWEKDGKKNYATEIIAEEVNFVGGKSELKTSNTTADNDNEFIELEDDDSLPF